MKIEFDLINEDVSVDVLSVFFLRTGAQEVASHLIAATRRYLQTASKVEKPPIWVGSDGWSNREIVTSGTSLFPSNPKDDDDEVNNDVHGSDEEREPLQPKRKYGEFVNLGS